MGKVWAVLTAVVFAFSASAAALAETYGPTPLSASDIFSRARQAAGGRDPGTYKEVQRITGYGVVRTRTTYYGTDDDSKSVTEGGGFTFAGGMSNKRSWSQDENGVVRLTAKFRAHEDPNVLAFEHPDDPKYHVQVLGITQTAPREYVVDVNPPGGQDTYRYYDAKTFLLDRVVRYGRDRYRHVTEYSDYRTMFGWTIPFRIHFYDGRPQNDMIAEDLSFEKMTDPVDFSIPASRLLYHLVGTAPLTLPAKVTREGIVIRAQVNGRGLDFLLDSGAAGIFIDPDVAHQLGFTPYSRSTETIGGGDVDSGLVRIPSLSIGPLVLDNAVLTTSPYEREVGDSKVVGLIGYDFISSGVLEVDFKAGVLRVYPRAAFDPAKLGLTPLAAQLDDRLPRVDGSIENVAGHFLVDTGAFASMVFSDYLHKLPSSPEAGTLRIGTVGGGMDASVRNVTDLQFANVLFKSAQVIVPIGSTFDISDYDGAIGRDVLSLCRVFFDYPDSMLYADCGKD